MKQSSMRWELLCEPHLQPTVCLSVKGGEVAFRKKGGKSVIYNKREKYVQKDCQSAAGEL